MRATSGQYAVLCYHYIRPDVGDRFPRLLGPSESMFRAQIEAVAERYRILGPEDIEGFHLRGESWNPDDSGVLFTFDDGLSDHLRAAEILAEYGIRGIFFVPTCPLQDRAPANPIIIHYGLAAFGLEAFLEAYHDAIAGLLDRPEAFRIDYRRGATDPWQAIGEIKSNFKYRLQPPQARAALLRIFDGLIRPQFADALDLMHLDLGSLREISRLGHRIGAHSRTHVSIGSACSSADEFDLELIEPGLYLAGLVGDEVNMLSFPFGEARDCLSPEQMGSLSTHYDLAFTVEPEAVGATTNRLALGRYMPMSNETERDLLANVARLFH